jgi:hypothetical protein
MEQRYILIFRRKQTSRGFRVEMDEGDEKQQVGVVLGYVVDSGKQ